LAHLPLRPGPAGWDNAHWLLGDEFAVRIPRRVLADQLLVHEARWLPLLAPGLPVPVPTPVVAGRPAAGWTTHWNVVPWLSGLRLDAQGSVGGGLVDDLAGFLTALHVPAPVDAPHNPYRSVPLGDRRVGLERALAELDRWARRGQLPHGVDGDAVPVLRAAFEVGVAAGEAPGRTWIHGDLHPGNLLAGAGRLTAVVDWGDVAAGDPAADLAVRWWALPVALHARFVAALPAVDGATWARAAGWAAAIGAFLLTQAPRAGDDALLATARSTVDRLAAG
jgi:aminoglycoside phosphotransferase (APT) family kinase protein